MNYRNIISNQKLRFKILELLNFVPDSIMLRLQYYLQLGRWPNLKNPQRYTEKLQVYKMKYRNPLMGKCVDKYDVREYVESCGLGAILNKCYGVYDRAENIDFGALPDKFVIKTTDGGGAFNVLICKNKSELDIPATIQKLNSWLNFLITNPGREWAYTLMKNSRIIVERFLDCNGDLLDYKFFCFNGKVYCSYLIEHQQEVLIGFLDRDFRLMKVHRSDYAPMLEQPEKPTNYDKMVEYAEILSKPFPHVRVDFYNIDGEIVFGELTFYTSCGYIKFNPDSFDYELGENFDISLFMAK